MNDNNIIKNTADAIKGVVDAVPVYQDVVQPAACQIGNALETVAKVIQVALAPLRALVWGFEQISSYLESRVSERLQSIPLDRIQTPPPRIAGPAIEALRFTAQEPDLREMYANLLATAMDSMTENKAHPAFVETIKQLSPLDARIFKLIASKRYTLQPLLDLIIYSKPPDFEEGGVATVNSSISLLSKDTDHKLVAASIDNLIRLGLVSSSGSLFHKPIYEELMRLDIVQKHLKEKIPSLKPDIRYRKVEVPDFGQMFIDACVIEKHVGLAKSMAESTGNNLS